MREVVFHRQMSLDGRISNSSGFSWKPLRFGEPATPYVDDAFRAADTWAVSRNIHPAVLAGGPRLFGHLTRDLALDLIHAEVFDSGAVIARHAVQLSR